MRETEVLFLLSFYCKFEKSEVTGIGAHSSEARGGSQAEKVMLLSVVNSSAASALLPGPAPRRPLAAHPSG